jgi:hypothetical protein
MENTPNFTNVAYYVQTIYNIVEMEREIELMLKDNVLDVFVDTDGTFSYQITDHYYNQLTSIDTKIERKNSTFKEMCMLRGINQKIYDEYHKTKIS